MPKQSGTGMTVGDCLLRILCTTVIWLGIVTPVQSAVEPSAGIHLALSSNLTLKVPSQKELAAIFLGQKRHWKDGTRVKIAILAAPDEQRKFLSAVARRSPGQYWAHWRNIVFSGRGIMPKIFDTEEELLGYLATEEGAIGHVINTELAGSKGAATLTIDGAQEP